MSRRVRSSTSTTAHRSSRPAPQSTDDAVVLAAGPGYAAAHLRSRAPSHSHSEFDTQSHSRATWPGDTGGGKALFPKNDAVEIDGALIDTLPNSQFTTCLDHPHELQQQMRDALSDRRLGLVRSRLKLFARESGVASHRPACLTRPPAEGDGSECQIVRSGTA